MVDKDKWHWYWNHDNQDLAEFVSPTGERTILQDKVTYRQAELLLAILNSGLEICAVRDLVTRAERLLETNKR